MKAAGLKGLFQSMAISWNLPFGLHSEETRDIALRGAMQSCFAKNSETLPLFVAHSKDLYNMLFRMGHSFEGADLDKQVWNKLKVMSETRPLGRKLSFARFQSCRHTAKKRLPWWEYDLFERTYTALETDVLHGKAFTDKVETLLTAAEEVPEGGVTTTVKRVTAEQRTMVGACKQALGASVWLLNNAANKKIVQM
eukprot:3895110-Pyramimonas_sp.AAC.1